jgi:uncharacterized protein YndB with AHSA1/START domain
MSEHTETTEQELFTISRTFDAPRSLVWQAWTDSEQLAQWWGPKGCKLRVDRLDFRPGGVFIYAMEFQPGQEMWGRFIYRDIVAPEKLVFINSFSDANGGITRAPFSPTWPLEILNTLKLTEKAGKTTLDLRGSPINATEAERKTFEGMRNSLRQGFTGTFDQLETYLKQAK